MTIEKQLALASTYNRQLEVLITNVQTSIRDSTKPGSEVFMCPHRKEWFFVDETSEWARGPFPTKVECCKALVMYLERPKA